MIHVHRARRKFSGTGLALVVIALSAGCPAATLLSDSETTELASTTEWAVIMYMPAGPALDSQAIVDLEAIDAAGLEGTGVRVLALVDREGGGTASGWTGTRLYEIPHMIPIGVPELQIEPGASDVSLDMNDPRTLRALLSFVEERYRPRSRALILWGEGTGYHHAVFLSEAMAGGGVDLLGLDMSFGATMEIAWEIRGVADLIVASQGVVPVSGWDYEGALRRFIASDRTGDSLAEAIVTSYAESRGSAPHATISTIRLDRIEPVMDALNAFSDAVRAAITDAGTREAVRASMFYDVEDFYATPGDLAIDLGDLPVVVSLGHGIAEDEAARLERAVYEAVGRNYRGPANPRASGISVHLIPLRSDGSAAASHHENYLNRPGETAALSFVGRSTWVPTLPSGPGLLFRLFYEPM